MSKFLSKEAGRLDPYTPGEQPQDQQYIKLNTNESPFPPSPKVLEALSGAEIARLNLYSDPTCASLTAAIAGRCHVQPENVIAGNGSDEILAFSFRAFCGEGKPLAYADITYGFYKSQVALFGLESKVIPLREDFTLCVDDYMDFPGTIVIANPNAPTGMAVPRSDIRRLLEADPNRVVIVDEAYVQKPFAGRRTGWLRHRLFGADCRAEPGEIQLQSLQRQPSQHGGRNGRHGGRGLFPRLHRRRLQ